jgi:hypothetical protein
MGYRDLDKDDFDAIVTGELTHYAIWMEKGLIDLISGYFSMDEKGDDFKRLLLRRDGLTFQDKIEIVRAMLPILEDLSAAKELAPLLTKIEKFKTKRNALAHGVDQTPPDHPKGEILIEIVTRSGKERIVPISPESHEATLAGADTLLNELRALVGKLVSTANDQSKSPG